MCNRKMNTIFMNSKNSETSDTHKLLINFIDKINLKEMINKLLCQILALPYMEKYKKVI